MKRARRFRPRAIHRRRIDLEKRNQLQEEVRTGTLKQTITSVGRDEFYGRVRYEDRGLTDL
jgi:hypothetical protein